MRTLPGVPMDRPKSCSGLFRKCSLVTLALAAIFIAHSEAVAQGWRLLSPSGGPVTGNRQMGLIVDAPRNRLVAAGGENSDGQTWAFALGGSGGWTSLNASVPDEAKSTVRAVYDPSHQRMLLMGSSMTVYTLDLATPNGWSVLATQGTPPAPRSYPGVAYDSRRGRLLLFGGLGGVGTDIWALDLNVPLPTWNQLVPSNAGPVATWASVAIFDPVRDQLVVATGSPFSDEVWALALTGSHVWTKLATSGPSLPPRYLAAGIYDPGADALVICGGLGGGALNDIWSLGLGGGSSWSQLPTTGGPPPARWSHAVAYWPGASQLIMYGGWTDHWHSDVWSYQLSPNGSPADVAVNAVAPSGTLSPSTPSLVVPVTIARTDATPVLGYSVRFHLTGLDLSGSGTSGISEGDFLSASNPATLLQVTNNGGGSYTVDNVTLGAPCGSSALTGTLFGIAVSSSALAGPGFVMLDEVTVYDCNNAPTTYAVGPAASVAVDYTPPAVTVTSPVGGEVSPLRITWTATDNVAVASVDLSLSTDGGATFPILFANDIPNTDSFDWAPPPLVTTQARVRVTAYDVNGNVSTDISDADFTLGQYLLTVNVGNGTVTKHPDQASYELNSEVLLTAIPDPGYHFVDWTGDVIGTTNPVSVRMGGHKTITANIAVNPPVAPITELAVSQVSGGNDADGTTKIGITWPAVAPGQRVEIYRAGFGGYPHYDGMGGTVPTIPSYPPSEPWHFVAAASRETTDSSPARDYYYYVAFVTDQYGTVSPASNLAGGVLNYHLGDVSDGVTPGQGDNQVGIADISLLGFHYGATGEALVGHEFLDVGPTTDRSVRGRPTTDGKVNIEDLLLFGLNYGTVSAPSLAASYAAVPGPDELSLRVSEDSPGSVVVRLGLRGTGSIQALSAVLGWNRDVVAPTGITPGQLLEEQHGVVLSPGPGIVDAALLGARAQGMSGVGDVATMTFRRLKAGDDGIVIQSVMARSASNQDLPLETMQQASSLPTTTSLAPVTPNPFRSTATLSFSLSRSGFAELEIFSVDGRRVRTLAHGERQAGEYRVNWDGFDDFGRSVGAGIYFARLTTSVGRVRQTLVRLR